MTDLNAVLRKQSQRYQLLRRLYEVTEGLQNKIVPFFEIATQAGFGRSETSDAYEYLRGEGLLKPMTLGGGVVITHRGIIEVENSITEPSKPTEHFMPQVIQHFHGNVGGVVTGNQNTMYVSNERTEAVHEVLRLVGELEDNLRQLPPEKRPEAKEALDNLKIEVESVAPKASRVKAAAFYVGNFFREVAVNVTTNLIEKSAGIGG